MLPKDTLHVSEETKGLTEYGRDLLEETRKIKLGALWVLQAMAYQVVKKGLITSENYLLSGEYIQSLLKQENNRIAEIHESIMDATEIATKITYEMLSIQSGNPLSNASIDQQGFDRKADSFTLAYFSEFIGMHLVAQEKINDANIIMVAGHQGVGKGKVTSLLQSQGYEILPMSLPVREVAAVWGLDDRQTIEKIVTGQIIKEYFGQDILLQLSTAYLLLEDKLHIVIDGPRVPGEAQAAIEMGCKLLGIVTGELSYDNDRELRRKRIKKRADEEPARAGDVGKFDEREAIEGKNITAILDLVPRANLIINSADTKPEQLEEQLRIILAA